jgi:hypothetical protein
LGFIFFNQKEMKTYLLKIILLAITTILLCQCQPEEIDVAHLKGEWQTDSIYSYQNGYEFTIAEGENWGTYQYKDFGKIAEKKLGGSREYLYEVIGNDSLIYKNPDNTPIAGFVILKLSANQLVLKKERKPTFSGRNQEIYEIRYFSKISTN